MSTITMTIAAINEPKPGKTRGTIQSTDGVRLGVFAEKRGMFVVGNTYEIEHSDGEYRNVLSARQVSAPIVSLAAARDAAAAPAAAAVPAGKEYGWQTHPLDARRMFICSMLNAAIQKGLVTLDPKSLAEATSTFLRLWHWTNEQSAVMERQPPRSAQG